MSPQDTTDLLNALTSIGWAFTVLGFLVGLVAGFLLTDVIDTYRYWSDTNRQNRHELPNSNV